jgi:hypothetical protein
VKRRSLVLASVLLLAGCDDDKIEIKDLQGAVIEALCERGAACHQYPSVDACKATLLLDYQQLETDFDEHRIKYDAVLAFKCVDAIRNGQGPGSCSVTDRLAGVEIAACKGAVMGTVDYQQRCFATNECQDGLYCDLSGCRDGECCAGSCEGLSKIGGNCSAPGSVCEDSGFCSDEHDGSGLRCRAKANKDEACVGSAGCAAGYLCFSQPARQGPTCGRLPAHGQRCASEDGPRCDSFSDYCDAGGICSTRIALGQPCGPDKECASYASCDPASQVCVEKGRIASPCSKDDDCLGSLRCASGVCVSPVFPQSCSSSAP